MEPRWAQTGRDGPDDDEGGQQRPPSSLFLQLPSNATLRFRGSVAKAWGAALEEGEPPRAPQERDGEEAGEQDSIPLKQLPLCMAEKRRLRLQEQQAAWKRSRWERWQVGTRRLRGQVGDALLYAQVWRGSLHHIEGHFGTGIQSYFNFLHFLVLLNLGGALLTVGFVVAPNAAFEGLRLNQTQKGPNSTVISSCLQYDPTKRGLVSYFTYLMDLLSGTGFMELTHLFYGYYQNSAVHFVGFSYNIPLAYLLSVLGYFSICLLWIVRRAVHLLKRSLVSENGALSTYSNKVFAGWDFCLGPGTAVPMKHNSLRYELRMDLEEQTLRRLMAQRSPGQRLGLYGLRGAVNLLGLVLLGAAFYCVYLATEYSQRGQENSGLGQQGLVVGLLVAYLPSIVITAANQLVPLAFGVLVRLERYPLSLEIRLTLIRTVFLRLSSLLVLLISLWSQITCNGDPDAESCRTCRYDHKQHPCWETSVGQEMYKLLVFDLLMVLLVLLLVEFPRKLLVTHGPAPLARLWGQQEFLVPPNVLDLVYGQTVCWVGAAFSPLLPLLNTAKFVLLFYLKQFTLFSTCRPAERTFRASSTSCFFLLVLLLGLAMAWVPLLYSVFVLQPSQACGPFRGEPTMWSTLWAAIDTLPHVAREFLQFVGSLAFAVPLFLLLCILMFYLMALAHSYSRLVKELKGQLQLEGRDKVFLVTQITELS
ncbi:LOW QUALITY PROTEIN: transmembrane channel-like protein 4 [Gopherus flavomarginatus]|uniref:LOW QUALITY PROTEIN: transmembrane channel-like protein 4 n=1 Tax=Gopherus flavomarginatus TaxID=286002 RepID=UPI0021CBEB30|nr:LOW QUALITY PROTEIN: transmembrane channel-like protein 4 [Gopherus flavomarginatus]